MAALIAKQETAFKASYGCTEDAVLARRYQIRVNAVRELAARLCLSKDKAWTKTQGGRSRMPRWTVGVR